MTHWKRLHVLKERSGRVPSGDGPDPSGPRAHGIYRPPLVGDPVYGRSGKTHGKILKELQFHRQALHATELGFTTP